MPTRAAASCYWARSSTTTGWPSACSRCSSRRKEAASMTWSDFYLLCFVLGFIMSALALFGTLHVDIPHFHFNFGGAHHGGHVAHGGQAHEAAHINIGTIAAFLAWFGGTGYLLARFSPIWALVGFAAA